MLTVNIMMNSINIPPYYIYEILPLFNGERYKRKYTKYCVNIPYENPKQNVLQ
jgi:hypothetical protein